MHALQPENFSAGHPETTTDDLAFIAQFADIEETLVPLSSFASTSSSAKRVRDVPAVSKLASITSGPITRKNEDEDRIDSEDEIEYLLDGTSTLTKSIPLKRCVLLKSHPVVLPS